MFLNILIILYLILNLNYFKVKLLTYYITYTYKNKLNNYIKKSEWDLFYILFVFYKLIYLIFYKHIYFNYNLITIFIL